MHPQAGGKGLHSRTLQVLEQSVAHWVMSRNVIVLMIPMVSREGDVHRSDIRLRDYARTLDGLVLQGGADLSPRSYGEEPLRPEWSGDAIRDAYELELLEAFLAERKPVLGICRGMQLINVAFGGSLYQDIPSQLPGAITHEADDYDRHAHDVCIEPGGLLDEHLGGERQGAVISIHHQAVKRLGHGLKVEARSAGDGLVEAISSESDGFVLGLQWHPEFHPPGRGSLLDGDALLDGFLQAARDAAASADQAKAGKSMFNPGSRPSRGMHSKSPS
jgi:putative glutamine amidotransferase